MLAHKHGLGLGTLVGTRLFMALIVVLARNRVEENPKKEENETVKMIKYAFTHSVTLQKAQWTH